MTPSTSPLTTDLYELNMVQAYLDKAEDKEAVFLAADDETPSGTLFVRVGHWRVVITREAEPPETAESILPTLTALAKAAIPKLRRAG